MFKEDLIPLAQFIVNDTSWTCRNEEHFAVRFNSHVLQAAKADPSCPREWIAYISGSILLLLRETWASGEVAPGFLITPISKSKNCIGFSILLKTKLSP